MKLVARKTGYHGIRVISLVSPISNCAQIKPLVFSYIYIHSKIQRAVLFKKLLILQDTHIIKSIILRKYEQCFPNTELPVNFFNQTVYMLGKRPFGYKNESFLDQKELEFFFDINFSTIAHSLTTLLRENLG